MIRRLTTIDDEPCFVNTEHVIMIFEAGEEPRPVVLMTGIGADGGPNYILPAGTLNEIVDTLT